MSIENTSCAVRKTSSNKPWEILVKGPSWMVNRTAKSKSPLIRAAAAIAPMISAIKMRSEEDQNLFVSKATLNYSNGAFLVKIHYVGERGENL